MMLENLRPENSRLRIRSQDVIRTDEKPNYYERLFVVIDPNAGLDTAYGCIAITEDGIERLLTAETTLRNATEEAHEYVSRYDLDHWSRNEA